MNSSRLVHPCRRLSTLKSKFALSTEVKKALNDNKAVVALESTVITHGLPYPNNLETAKSLEEIIRAEGATPATIALLDGNVHIGLSSDQLQRVADTVDSVKVSKRDIAHTLVEGVIGGTTVAATMFLANIAGIKVFSTGGIGGVHRGADQTFDISADLLELSATPVAVVCAGVKSILDIEKTVEMLETLSVNTIAFAERNVFPGFFTPTTTCKAQFATLDYEKIANVIEKSKEFGLTSGTLVAVPIPKEHQAHGDVIEEAIQKALKEAAEKSVRSQQMTPFLLKRVNELTKGSSMKTNIALLQNNARVGANLAKALAQPRRLTMQSTRSASTSATSAQEKKPKIVVVGATIVDFEAITHQDVKDDGGSYEGTVAQRCGGVGRNHADALTRLGSDVSFISAIGEDQHGDYFMQRCSHMNLSSVIRVPGVPTAVYMSQNVKGNVRYGVSCIGPIVERISPDLIRRNEEALSISDYIVIDGNIARETVAEIVAIAKRHSRKVWFDPTDIAKVRKVYNVIDDVAAISPNALEFVQFVERHGLSIEENMLKSPEHIGEFVLSHPALMHNLNMLRVSLGRNGTSVIVPNHTSFDVHCLGAPISDDKVVSVSGAGDCLNSGIITGLVRGLPIPQCLQLGQKCAGLTLQTTEAVSTAINADLWKSFL